MFIVFQWLLTIMVLLSLSTECFPKISSKDDFHQHVAGKPYLNKLVTSILRNTPVALRKSGSLKIKISSKEQRFPSELQTIEIRDNKDQVVFRSDYLMHENGNEVLTNIYATDSRFASKILASTFAGMTREERFPQAKLQSVFQMGLDTKATITANLSSTDSPKSGSSTTPRLKIRMQYDPHHNKIASNGLSSSAQLRKTLELSEPSSKEALQDAEGFDLFISRSSREILVRPFQGTSINSNGQTFFTNEVSYSDPLSIDPNDKGLEPIIKVDLDEKWEGDGSNLKRRREFAVALAMKIRRVSAQVPGDYEVHWVDFEHEEEKLVMTSRYKIPQHIVDQAKEDYRSSISRKDCKILVDEANLPASTRH